MAQDLPFIPSRKSQNDLLEYFKTCANYLNNSLQVRDIMRQIDLKYMREQDWTEDNIKSRLANMAGDANKFQNVTLPVILPAVEAAVTYQSAVFLQGSPIFGCVSNPATQDAAMQLEAKVEQDQIKGGWIRHLQMFLRDGFKYNICGLEASWCEEQVPTLSTNAALGKDAEVKQVLWAGNKIERLDMYNTFWDVRVPITEVSKEGEFAGYTKIYSRIGLKRWLQSLPSYLKENEQTAFLSQWGTNSSNNSSVAAYYLPTINPAPILLQNTATNWYQFFTGERDPAEANYSGMYQVSTFYVRLIPREWALNVPSRGQVQIWKLVFVNQQVLIQATRMNNAHANLPTLFGSPLEDGLSYQTKSLATNVQDIQSLGSALVNSVVAARRKAISDRMLFDPSRVASKDINSANPSAKIPVRQAAYGKPLGEAIYPIPFRDDQSQIIMQEIGMFGKLSDVITGQNPARQGQFVKGNKTQTEYSDVMNNSNGRDQGTSLLLEDQCFAPLKEIVKLNTLQYVGPQTVYYRAKEQAVTIDPVALRNAALDFKMTDGLTPASKQINSDGFQVILQAIATSPQIASGYNIAPLISYLAEVQGANIEDFEKSQEQVAYEQAMSSWQSFAQMAAQKGVAFNQPMPLPANYGYLQQGQLKQTAPKEDALTTFMSGINQLSQQAPAGATQPTQEQSNGQATPQ